MRIQCHIVNCIIIIILNLGVFFFISGVGCIKYIIVFSLENTFPIALSGELLCPRR
jgi:hypothetical protein